MSEGKFYFADGHDEFYDVELVDPYMTEMKLVCRDGVVRSFRPTDDIEDERDVYREVEGG